jgi:hypothetical protein
MCAGEFTVAPSLGEETQTDPAEVDPGVGGGTGAGAGKFAVPVLGPWLMTDCTVGQVLALGPGVGVGAGVGAGAGVGVGEEPVGVGLGVGVVFAVVSGESPQPASVNRIKQRARVSGARRHTRSDTADHL